MGVARRRILASCEYKPANFVKKVFAIRNTAFHNARFEMLRFASAICAAQTRNSDLHSSGRIDIISGISKSVSIAASVQAS